MKHYLVSSSNNDSACKLKCISLLSNQCKTNAGRGLQNVILGTNGMSVSALTEAAKWKCNPGVTPVSQKKKNKVQQLTETFFRKAMREKKNILVQKSSNFLRIFLKNLKLMKVYKKMQNLNASTIKLL